MPKSALTQELDPAHRRLAAKAKARNLPLNSSITQLTANHRHLMNTPPFLKGTPTTKRIPATARRTMAVEEVHPTGRGPGILKADLGGESLQSANGNTCSVDSWD